MPFSLSESGPDEDCGPGEDVPPCREWELPARQFHGLWESLVLESGLRRRLLAYATSGLALSAAGVDPRLVAWNRVVLLHGPPGTGKTSLCQGLAQQLAIRLGGCAFPGGARLVDVSAHSLFSKWFSESGKLVTRLFARIADMADDESMLVVVLIDEVESLAAARSAAIAGGEPSDAVRAVNALLTQLDGLKHRRNVIVMATSNVTAALDAAFVDRADIVAYLGPPGLAARYAILASAVTELLRCGVVSSSRDGSTSLPPFGAAAADEARRNSGGMTSAGAPPPPPGVILLAAARASDGLSGRALRKLPFLAHASLAAAGAATPTLTRFESALLAAAVGEAGDRAALGNAR